MRYIIVNSNHSFEILHVIFLYYGLQLEEQEKGTNFAYCPPKGNYGTIDAYQWTCSKGPNGKTRQKAPHFSNPDVYYQGVPTGDLLNNNAGYITNNRFKSRDKGSNCLDGKPNENWEFGDNCLEGKSSYFHPPIDQSKGIFSL